MGLSLAWMAARSRAPDELLDALDLERTEDETEDPVAAVCATPLATGWYVIVVNDVAALDAEAAARLSNGRAVVSVHVDERVMYASAEGFKDGTRTWSVVHDAEQGILHLATDGKLPIEFSGVRAWHEHDQKAKGGADAREDCIFEIPIDLAKRLVGFRHDEDLPGLKRAHWEVLRKRALPVPAPIEKPTPVALPVERPVARPTPEPEPAEPQQPNENWRARRRRERAEVRARARHEERERQERRAPKRTKRRRRAGGKRSFWQRLGDLILDGLTKETPETIEDARRRRLLDKSRARRKKRQREQTSGGQADQRP